PAYPLARSPPFPYPPLFRSRPGLSRPAGGPRGALPADRPDVGSAGYDEPGGKAVPGVLGRIEPTQRAEADHRIGDHVAVAGAVRDRKSTRLNYSHEKISYAV